jgi:hypothetical protein
VPAVPAVLGVGQPGRSNRGIAEKHRETSIPGHSEDK